MRKWMILKRPVRIRETISPLANLVVIAIGLRIGILDIIREFPHYNLTIQTSCEDNLAKFITISISLLLVLAETLSVRSS
jgi:hypothetical protein